MDGSEAASGDHGDARVPLWVVGIFVVVAQVALLVVVLR